MKKLKIILILIIIQSINQNFIPILINKINKNIEIEKILINKKNNIKLINLKYKNEKINIKNEKIYINLKKNKIKLKNIFIFHKNEKFFIKKIKLNVIINKKSIKVNIPNIKISNQNIEINGKINLKKYIKKYTFVLNKSVIKEKQNTCKKIKIKTKNIKSDCLIKNMVRKTLILVKLSYKNIKIHQSLITIKKNIIIFKITKIKTFNTYIKNIKIKIIQKKLFYEIKIEKELNKINKIILNKKQKKILIINNVKYKNYIIKNPEKIKIDKKHFNLKNIILTNKIKQNSIIIKAKISYNTTLFGIFYIHSIKMDLPIIKMLTKKNTLCNVYIKGKIYKSLIYTQNIIQYKV